MKKFLCTIKRGISLFMTGVILLFPVLSTAAPLTDISDELSTLKVSTAANHSIQFVTPTGAGDDSGDTIILTFQSDFSLGSVAFGDIDMAYDTDGSCGTFSNSLTLAATAAAGSWGVANSGQTLTFTEPTDSAGAITAGRCVQILIGTNASGGSDQITNTTTTGSKTVAFTGTFGDEGTTTVEILTDDQVQLSAEVPQSISFSLSHNSASFGNLTSASARWATSTGSQSSETVAHLLVAGTNASSGYAITVEGDTLTSGGNTISAIGGSALASSPGSEQFGMRLTASGGSGAVTAPYGTANYAYAASSGTTDQVASASGSTADTVYSAYYIANIASNTEAGTYTATLTYVATANY